MFNINVESVRPVREVPRSESEFCESYKVTLTSEDRTEAVVLDARLLLDQEGDFSVDFPRQSLFPSDGAHQYARAIRFSKNLLHRIIDQVRNDYRDHHDR